jgi:hypothetical protein
MKQENVVWSANQLDFICICILLTPEHAVEHDHVQNLPVVEAPTGVTGTHRRSDQYAASATCTMESLPKKNPVGEKVSWVDLASAG